MPEPKKPTSSSARKSPSASKGTSKSKKGPVTPKPPAQLMQAPARPQLNLSQGPTQSTVKPPVAPSQPPAPAPASLGAEGASSDANSQNLESNLGEANGGEVGQGATGTQSDSEGGNGAVGGMAGAGGAGGVGGVGGGMNGIQPRRGPLKPPLLRPRKVRGGVKIPAGDVASPTAWAAQRWLRLLEVAAEGAKLVEGLEYARSGQAKRIGMAPGRIEGVIQGRSERPYATIIAIDMIPHETWDKVVETMAEGSLYAAKLLAAELPPNIEDAFAPMSLKLFPVEPSEVRHCCTCFDWRAENGSEATVPKEGKWCKHVACLGYLLAQKLAQEAFTIFMLRGLEGQELLERLRQRRVVAGAAMGLTPIYSQRVPGLSDNDSPALEDSMERFWDAGPELHEIDLPLTSPPVSHPILRRLGQSPFQQAAFPLVGLLASCYDTISERARRDEAPAAPVSHEDDDQGHDQGQDEDDISGEP